MEKAGGGAPDFKKMAQMCFYINNLLYPGFLGLIHNVKVKLSADG